MSINAKVTTVISQTKHPCTVCAGKTEDSVNNNV
jgi:hypothetical protein